LLLLIFCCKTGAKRNADRVSMAETLAFSGLAQPNAWRLFLISCRRGKPPANATPLVGARQNSRAIAMSYGVAQ
jgi:hypothetical protein